MVSTEVFVEECPKEVNINAKRLTLTQMLQTNSGQKYERKSNLGKPQVSMNGVKEILKKSLAFEVIVQPFIHELFFSLFLAHCEHSSFP